LAKKDGLYIVLVSVHGLIRGQNIELGRDADTGGQIKYVVELARWLAEHPEVARVDLLTRQIFDNKIDKSYAEPEEMLSSKARIFRLPFGPRRYLRKEVLWNYIDCFSDRAMKHIRRAGRVPDVIHGHYADAGYIAAQLSTLLEVPMIFTGHSLGRVKEQRLLEQGVKREVIEGQYHITQRIEAEETALDNALFVVASTQQEIDEQYSLYDNHHPENMMVIPPGIDLERFHPATDETIKPPIYADILRFLKDEQKPIILALSRPDVRKNICSLVRAYAETPRLREMANLLVIAGSRDDIMQMEKGPRRVLSELLLMIDHYDLYGHVAYPKRHAPDEVPDIYRMVAQTRGIFVNPALTEPFGLTLLEAAATGLPIIATEDGGPKDIIANCKNGALIDPLNTRQIGDVLVDLLNAPDKWQRWSKAGIKGTRKYYSWTTHVERYIEKIDQVTANKRNQNKPNYKVYRSRLPTADRMLVCDIDNTLIGDKEALKELLHRLSHNRDHIGFGVATGRRLQSVKKILQEWDIPTPDFIIASVGCEIYYGSDLHEDRRWKRHIDYRWDPQAVCDATQDIPGLKLQSTTEQRKYKVSYFYDPKIAPSVRKIIRYLRKKDIHVNVVYSHQMFLDFLPVRASKGAALRYFADKWGIPVEHILVVGDSGNDLEMLSGETLGVIVGNHSSEMRRLHGRDRVYFAEGKYAQGIIEGMEYYNFLDQIRIPRPDPAP